MAVGAPWSAVAAGFAVLFVCTGVNFSFGILFKPILLDFGWDRSTLALAATASLAVNGLLQVPFGTLIDRVGPRRVILPSMALMAIGTGLVALVQSPWHLILLYGVVASIGNTGSGILPVSVHVTRWFPVERGFVMAVTASGFSLGQLVFTQFAAHAAAAVGWRRTYVLMALILSGFLVVLPGWLRDAPRGSHPLPRLGGEGPGEGPVSLDRRRALGTPAFWWMTAGFLGCGFTDFLLTTHLAAFATDVGLSSAVAANAFSLWAGANLIGILLGGALAVRLDARRALVATYLVRAASLFLLPGAREAWQLYVFAVLFGATFFTTAPLSSTLVGSLFGPTHQGVIFGAATFFHHMAGALGSYAGGLVFDLHRSYTPIFLAGGVLVLGSAVVTAWARRPPDPSGFLPDTQVSSP